MTESQLLGVCRGKVWVAGGGGGGVKKWFKVSILSIHYFLTENFFRRSSVYSSVTMFKCVVRTGEATSFE